MRDIPENKSIAIWLKKACGSEGSVQAYRYRIRRFFEHVGIEPDALVSAWKKVKYDLRLRDQFLDEWTEKVEGYVYNLEGFAPTSRMQELTVIVSFFKHNRIPIEPERDKHVYVKNHNRDIKRKEIKRILEHAHIRDRTFFLMMLESGLRPNTLVQLRYKHIKEDFEANRVPMMIDLPSELLKDRVEARWTFIGEDGFKTLKEYLKPRLPLKNEDLIFAPKRSDMKHQFLTPNTFSKIFSYLVLKLGMAERTERGKPKKVRLYNLRKWFSNNLRADRAFIEFWLGHKTTQTHYVSRNVERHREEYANAYPNLRIYKKTPIEVEALKKKLEITEKELKSLRELVNYMSSDEYILKKIGEILPQVLDERMKKEAK